MNKNNSNFFKDIPPSPKAWKFWLARFLGKKFTSTEDGLTITGYKWRGCFYILKEKYDEHQFN